jgi:hypothetical protein
MDTKNLKPEKDGSTGLAEAISKILDKGLVINADITVSVVGVELLGIKIRAALASFETAARYGLEFPSGTNLDAPGWRELTAMHACPECGEHVDREELLKVGCPWCGWKSARPTELELKQRVDDLPTIKSWK